MIVPTGITFGDKVLVVPDYSADFTHSGEVVSLLERQNYRWVQRGDPIAEFRISGSPSDSFLSRLTSTKLHSAVIRSPVSGLLLHTALGSALSGLERWNAQTEPPGASFALLLPDDEPKAESGEYVFADMCRLACDMRHYYFKSSRYWSRGAVSPEEFKTLLQQQSSAQPKVFDAMPRWLEYFDEARTRKPELRPYLKHLR
ncbi:MAG: hypothetical protein AAGG11_14920 [Pseudomonadota bacterium]